MNESSAKPRNVGLIALVLIVVEATAGILPRRQQQAALRAETLELAVPTVAVVAPAPGHTDLLSFTRITAPFDDDVVVARNTDIGGLLVADSVDKELFRIAQISKLRVFVRVPQSLALGVAPGQTAELTIPELPGRVFTAKVVRTSGAMFTDSRTLLTELEVENEKGEIFSGSYAQVRLTQAKQEAALTVPANTLFFRAEGPQVGVVRADNKVELRSATLGRDFGRVVKILEGLSPSDRVVLNPPDSLIGGAIVRVAQ